MIRHDSYRFLDKHVYNAYFDEAYQQD